MKQEQNISIELSAVVVNVWDNEPQIILENEESLPSGPLEIQHEKLAQGLRSWVHKITGLNLGYVEQLYTFADKDRNDTGNRVISIGYLALTQGLSKNSKTMNNVSWYKFFPWEDHRTSPPKKILNKIRKNLNLWIKNNKNSTETKSNKLRIKKLFPSDLKLWNEELVLQRYELLWEAGLIEESIRANIPNAKSIIDGKPMKHDHRRILATAIARLRSKIKYRPVVFELLPNKFTLFQLQQTVEALAGIELHKQNFRRLVQKQGIIEETKSKTQQPKGRPAKLFSCKKNIIY